MTQPGQIIPPRPSWWVRTGRAGIAEGAYSFDYVAPPPPMSLGAAEGTFGFVGAAFGGASFPYIFPFLLADGGTVGGLPLGAAWASGGRLTAVDENNLANAINGLVDGTLTIPKRVSSSSAATLVLTNAYNVYTFTGSTSTWTMPAISGNTGLVLTLYNAGSGDITLNRAGADSMYLAGTITTTTLQSGNALQALNDGTYWLLRAE